MLKSKNKSGYSIIEVICALGILSIIFSAVVKIHMDSLKLRSYNSISNKYAVIFEAVRNELLYNCSYTSIKSLSNSNTIYLGNEKLSISVIKNSNLPDLFTHEVDITKPYMIMNVADGKTLKLTLELHYKFNNKDELYKCQFLKGNYT